MAFDTASVPLSFKTAQGRLRSSLLTSGPVRDAIVVEARQLGHHFKEAVVQEGSHGSSWRLASDESAHLAGSDLAPFPLGYFNAGLQAELAGRVGRLARERGLPVARLGAGICARYALTGSYSGGSGQGYAESIGGHLAFETDVPDADLATLVRDAVAQSPAFDMVTRPLENTFALYCNGRRRQAPALPASSAPAPLDPFLKYKTAPVPIEAAAFAGQLTRATPGQFEIVAKTGLCTPGATLTATAPGSRITWSVSGEGMLDVAVGLYRSIVAHDRPGSSQFAFLADDTSADRAPFGLALVSAGIAFCYMTQLVRYIEAKKLAVRGVRLVQTSPFGIEPGGRGLASPCDTHLFLQGEADENVFEELQRIAAATCFLHQTMAMATPLKITASNHGRLIL